MLNQKSKNFTTTLPVKILLSLDVDAKELKVRKNDILSDAFLKWDRVRKQKLVAESYSKAANDPEWQDLANSGMEDSLKNKRLWEK